MDMLSSFAENISKLTGHFILFLSQIDYMGQFEKKNPIETVWGKNWGIKKKQQKVGVSEGWKVVEWLFFFF